MPGDVPVLEGFRARTEEALGEVLEQYGLAMDRNDLKFFQDYMRDEEGRDPTVTELRLVDTYWSDHCRHTTFSTHLDRVEIEAPAVRAAYERYLAARVEVYGPEKAAQRPQTLMDLATIGTKTLKKRGLLPELDESEEINACSIHVPAVVDGQEQDWLLMFKNETHNHPTEIEPFGGAATCIGGVHPRPPVRPGLRPPGHARHRLRRPPHPGGADAGGQAAPAEDRPDRRRRATPPTATRSAWPPARWRSSTTPAMWPSTWSAARWWAQPRRPTSVRETPAPGDVVHPAGRPHRPGRHRRRHRLLQEPHQSSLDTMASEVQKGNAPEERKIQRLFRDPAPSPASSSGATTSAPAACPWPSASWPTACPSTWTRCARSTTAWTAPSWPSPSPRSAWPWWWPPADVDALASPPPRRENLESYPVAAVTAEPRMVMRWRGKIVARPVPGLPQLQRRGQARPGDRAPGGRRPGGRGLLHGLRELAAEPEVRLPPRPHRAV